MKTIWAKALGSLVPAQEQAEDVLRGIPRGELVRVEVSRPRNLAHLRKFFAMCQLIAQNTDKVDDVDDLVFRLKIATGHCRRHVKADGTVLYEPRSISFAQMDQAAFDTFYGRCLDIVCAHIIPDLDKDEVEREVMAFIAPVTQGQIRP